MSPFWAWTSFILILSFGKSLHLAAIKFSGSHQHTPSLELLRGLHSLEPQLTLWTPETTSPDPAKSKVKLQEIRSVWEIQTAPSQCNLQHTKPGVCYWPWPWRQGFSKADLGIKVVWNHLSRWIGYRVWLSRGGNSP